MANSNGGSQGVGVKRFAVCGGPDGVGVIKLGLNSLPASMVGIIRELSAESPTDVLETFEAQLVCTGRICHGTGPFSLGPQVCFNKVNGSANAILTPGTAGNQVTWQVSLDGTQVVVSAYLIMLADKSIIASGTMTLSDEGSSKGSLGLPPTLIRPGETKPIGGGRIDGGSGVESDIRVSVVNHS